jgi:hypothetical protein
MMPGLESIAAMTVHLNSQADLEDAIRALVKRTSG